MDAVNGLNVLVKRKSLLAPGGKRTYGMHVVACYFPVVPKLKLKVTVSRCGGCKEVVFGRWVERKVDYIYASLKFAWIKYCKRNKKNT